MSEFFNTITADGQCSISRNEDGLQVYLFDVQNNLTPYKAAEEYLRVVFMNVLGMPIPRTPNGTNFVGADVAIRALLSLYPSEEGNDDFDTALANTTIQVKLDDTDVLYEVGYDPENMYHLLVNRVGSEDVAVVDTLIYPDGEADLKTMLLNYLDPIADRLAEVIAKDKATGVTNINEQVYQPPVVATPEPTLPSTLVEEPFMPPSLDHGGLVTMARVQCGDVTFSYMANPQSYAREIQVFVKNKLVLRYPGVMSMVLVDHMVKLWRKLALRLPANELKNLSSDDRVSILTAISDFANYHMGMPEITAMTTGLSDEIGCHLNNSIFCVMTSVYDEHKNALESTYTFTNLRAEEPEAGVPSLAFVSTQDYVEIQRGPEDIYNKYYNRINKALGYHPTLNEREERGIKPPMSILVACSTNGAIGAKGKLPWHIKADMIRFKKMTSGKVVIMGRKTFESLDYIPLPGRVNIVITRNFEEVTSRVPAGVDTSALIVVNSKEAAVEKAQQCIRETIDHIYIIGGEEIYNMFIDDVDAIYITSVDTVVEDADAFIRLENIANVWDITPDPIGPQVSEDGLAFSYYTLNRKTQE